MCCNWFRNGVVNNKFIDFISNNNTKMFQLGFLVLENCFNGMEYILLYSKIAQEEDLKLEVGGVAYGEFNTLKISK